MMGPTHTLLGSSTAILAGTVVGAEPKHVGAMAVIAWLWSKTPDTREYVGIKIPRRSHGRWRWLWLYRRRVFRHRGPTHWPELWVAGTLVVGSLLAVLYGTAGVLFAVGASIGYGMHLLGDACTLSGLEVRSLGRDRFGEVREVHVAPVRLRLRTQNRGPELWLRRLLFVGMGAFVWFTQSPAVLAAVS
jgi:hypothetical protein